jgi:2-oxoglutarate ferredoxin oxidoreductase subunit alpha
LLHTDSAGYAKSVELARAEGIKAGLLRPMTLFPFPLKRLNELADKVKNVVG